MKTIILCGGKGQRMNTSENDLPKAMALVKGKPLIYHIMKQYSKYGFNDFILPLGYKGKEIKKYFIEFEMINSNFTKETFKNSISYHNENDNFKVTLIDTGVDNLTASRIKQVGKYIDTDNFMVTYGDGLSDVNISELIKFHKEKGKIATVTGVKKKSQYGSLEVENGIAKTFKEKVAEEQIINGGFFIFKKEFLEYLDEGMLEEEPMKKLLEKKELAVFLHEGKWISVDTQKDLITANEVWCNG